MSTHALHLTKQSVKAEVNILSCLSLRNLSLFAVSTRQLSPPIGHFFSHFLSRVMNLQRQKFLQLCALLAVFSRVDHFHPNLYWLLYCTVYFFVFENGRACKNCLPYFTFRPFLRICSFGDWAQTRSCKLPDWLCAILLTIARLLCADTETVIHTARHVFYI